MSRGSPSPTAVLVGATAAQTAVALVNFGLPAVGPELQGDYGLGLFALGAVVSAGLLGSGLGLTGAGVLLDRLGARRVIATGVLVATAGLVAAALAQSGRQVFVALLVFGLGSAVVPVAGATGLMCAFPVARRGWALGVRQTAVPVGGLVGAIGCPALHAVGGSRAIFATTAALVCAAGLAFARVVDDGRAPRMTGAPWREIWASDGTRRLLLVAACYITTLQALLVYVVPAVRAAGESSLAATAAYVAVNVAGVLGRIAWGRIADRDGGTRRSRTLVEIGLVAATGAVLFALALRSGSVAVIPAAAAFGVGALGWNAVLYLTAGERVVEGLSGRAVALAATVVFVISGLATPVLGASVGVIGWTGLWLVAAATAAAGSLVARGLPGARRTA